MGRRAQRERPARPRSILRDGLTRLTAGMGLWLLLGGDAPVEWTREAPAGSVLLELRAGRNRAGWTGRDGVLVAEALARFGDSLVSASRWNAETGDYDRYRPGAPEEANTLRALRRGDALEVELTSDARWWQSGTARTKFEFLGGVPEQRQAEIRAETAEVLAFYAERYGIVPPEFTIRVHPGIDIVASAAARLIRIGRHAVDDPLIGGTIAHEYTHVLQHYMQRLPRYKGSSSPSWLIEGQATYASGLFFQGRGDRTGARQRGQWWRQALDVTPSLRDLARRAPFYAEGGAAYALGALATEWLVTQVEAREAGQSGAAVPPDSDFAAPLPEHDSHIRYWENVPSPDRWREALEATFGITVGDFYDAFEAYRAETIARIAPHRFDDRDGPALVFLGDVPDALRAEIEAELDRVHLFYTERFETVPADFSIFVGTDAETVAQRRLRTFGHEHQGACSVGSDVVIFDATVCGQTTRVFERHYFSRVRYRLAPWAWGSLPEVPDRRGPYWLVRGTEEYTEYAYRAAAEEEGTLEQTRNEQISLAGRTTALLSSLQTHVDADAAGYLQARALGFLAAERLVERAGEPALFEYYAALPDAADWREAFEAAFGIAPAAFYADFEAYRARVTVTGVTLRGVVLDPGGRPLAGAIVAESFDALLAESSRSSPEQTEADGTFAIRARDGRHHLAVYVFGTRCRLASGNVFSDTATTEVAGADVSGIAIRLPDDASCDAP